MSSFLQPFTGGPGQDVSCELKQSYFILLLLLLLLLLFYLFIFFMATLDLRCCAWAFFSCMEQGLVFIAVHGFLIAVASLVVDHGL